MCAVTTPIRYVRLMASWRDVERIAAGLPGARAGVAADGGPTFDIGRHHFARLRLDEGNEEILQFWTQDLATEEMLADRKDTFFLIETFKVKVSVWAWLEQLDRDELLEILTESWLARRGVRDRA
jgi:hypothetical protein